MKHIEFYGPPAVGVSLIIKTLALMMTSEGHSVAVVDSKIDNSDLYYMLKTGDKTEGCIPYGDIDFYFNDEVDHDDYDYILEEKCLLQGVENNNPDAKRFFVTDLDIKNIHKLSEANIEFGDNSALVLNKIVNVNVRESKLLKTLNSPEFVYHIPFNFETMAADINNQHIGRLALKTVKKDTQKAIREIMDSFMEPKQDKATEKRFKLWGRRK